MNTDLIVQPIDDIRAAVETLAAGLGRGEVISAELWDRSVTALARCHDQVGGDTRRQLYDVFGASADPQGEGRVAAHLEVLSQELQGSHACPGGVEPMSNAAPISWLLRWGAPL